MFDIALNILYQVGENWQLGNIEPSYPWLLLNQPWISRISWIWLWTCIILCIYEFNLLKFCWGFLQLCSWEIPFYNFLVMSLSGYGIRLILASWGRKDSLCFYLLEEIVKNWYNFFLKCLAIFTSEPVWTWCSQFWKVINYWFNFLNKYRPIMIVSSWVSLGRLCLPWIWYISSRLSNLWT